MRRLDDESMFPADEMNPECGQSVPSIRCAELCFLNASKFRPQPYTIVQEEALAPQVFRLVRHASVASTI